MHGAEIYTNYQQDKTVIGDNEVVDLEGKPMPYEFTINAINKIFPDNATSIIKAFHKILIFDAFLGVNDRHAHNWGVGVLGCWGVWTYCKYQARSNPCLFNFIRYIEGFALEHI